MKDICHLAFFTILCLLSTNQALAFQKSAANELRADSTYAQLAESFINAEIDAERVATVNNLVFKRDVATYTLTNGKLFMVKPIASRTCMAVFIGSGQFSFTPPTTVEREQLKRFMKKETADIQFNSLVLLFADTTFTELSRTLKFTKNESSGDAKSVMRNALEFIGSEKYTWMKEEIMSCFLDKQESDLFYSLFVESTSKHVYSFTIDPENAEEISFYSEDKAATIGRSAMSLINRFHRADEYKEGVQMNERKNLTSIDDYVTDMKIESNLSEVSITATLTVTPRYDGRRWLHYSMSPSLKIQDIDWDKLANDRDFIKMGDELWIRAKEPLKKGIQEKITISYTGKIFRRVEDFVVMEIGSTRWYPRNDETERSTYTMTFTIPDNYKLWAAGDLIEEKKSGETITTVWKVNYPSIHSTFSIGVFREKLIEDKRIPPVRLWYGNYSRKQDNVAEDLLNSMIFYTTIFGKPPFEKMTAAELYAYHGQAFPGFLQLSFVTFGSGENDGSQESFVAHEMAHQWWGMALGWTNYHDQWMSEAFSEYSSLMYMQTILKDNEKFFKMLNKFKKDITTSRKSIFGDGIEQAPIWLGWRTGTSYANAGDYNLLIYKKGAWVLHMLRNLMMDLRTANDDRFLAMMKDFYTTYSGKDPTTQDFQAMVEKHTKQKMDWFFNQWIYGSKIPKYKVAYKTTQTPEGKFKVTMRVKSDNIPSDFMMVIPVLADFGDKGSAPLRTIVKGNNAEFDLPLLPMEPKKIDFNILESVLCDYEMVDWE